MCQSLSLKTQNTLQSRERCETRSSPPHPLAPSHLAPRTSNPEPRTPNLAPRTPNLAPSPSHQVTKSPSHPLAHSQGRQVADRPLAKPSTRQDRRNIILG